MQPQQPGVAQDDHQGMAEMKQAATVLDSSLRVHIENMSRFTQRQRWRPWLVGLAIAAASFVFFALGAVLQRETDVVSFGDPRHEWTSMSWSTTRRCSPSARRRRGWTKSPSGAGWKSIHRWT